MCVDAHPPAWDVRRCAPSPFLIRIVVLMGSGWTCFVLVDTYALTVDMLPSAMFKGKKVLGETPVDLAKKDQGINERL